MKVNGSGLKYVFNIYLESTDAWSNWWILSLLLVLGSSPELGVGTRVAVLVARQAERCKMEGKLDKNICCKKEPLVDNVTTNQGLFKKYLDKNICCKKEPLVDNVATNQGSLPF